jgi:hypothetical protein
MNAAFPLRHYASPNLLNLGKTIVVGLLAPQTFRDDSDAQLLCKFNAD